MRPLTQFVSRLREEMGEDAAIPNFDPWDGGINAEVLFLLEAPGPRARNSAFVSMNNPDETAKNFFLACQTTGIERKRIVIWNIVPWYIGSDTRIRAANASDIKQGISSLADLLSLLPKLRAIVLVGKKAQRAEKHLTTIAPSSNSLPAPPQSDVCKQQTRQPGCADCQVATSTTAPRVAGLQQHDSITHIQTGTSPCAAAFAAVQGRSGKPAHYKQDLWVFPK
ncbi:uracil-DNA glycosylase [Aeromonas jandaei]|nr:uracil-DNA glycosylase [Aeromonas jandaei]